jgi:hypothetical protein
MWTVRSKRIDEQGDFALAPPIVFRSRVWLVARLVFVWLQMRSGSFLIQFTDETS